MNNKKERVLVTGATGYIASHVIKELLEKNYSVRGTVRNLKNAKCDDLKKDNIFGLSGQSIELVEANLDSNEGWREALSECDYLIHMASPVPKGESYFNDTSIIDTALNGTKSVLEAASGIVKKVVMTSSSAAIMFPEGTMNDSFNFNAPAITEETWSNVEGTLKTIGAYPISKTKAELFAWDFYKSQKKEKAFELTTINPTVVIGPLLSPKIRALSLSFPYFAASGKIGSLPKRRIPLPYVDVRDVASAHVESLKNPKSNGERYILHNGYFDLADSLQELREEFLPLSKKWPKHNMPTFIFHLLSLFREDAKMLTNFMGPRHGKVREIISTKVTEHLDLHYRTMEDSLRDTINSFKLHGMIK